MTDSSKSLRTRVKVGLALGLVAGTLWAALEQRPDRALAQEAVASLPPPDVVSLAAAPDHTAAAEPAAAAATAPPDEPERWAIPAGAIDPRLATTLDGHLGQVLDDGTRIHFTLDPRLQDVARDTLERFRVEWGSVVAIRPKTGEILALAEYAHERPDLSRLALNANAPAASVFKVITSAALLEYAHLRPEDQLCTHGGHQKLTLYNLEPNERLDTRCESFAQALGSSNNVAFARWADAELEPLQLQAMANRFLFGKRLPFPWAVGVSNARVPTASRLGLARTAAGFEGTQLSTLHAALIMATVANDGVMMAPHLIARADRAGETLYEAAPAVLAEVLTAPIAKDLRGMLAETITYGTGKKFFWKGNKPRIPVSVGGKSGSLSGSEDGIKRQYSWFVALAPIEDPQIAVAALIVQGEQWTVKGAVPVREVLEAWFEGRGGARAPASDPAERDPLADP